MDCIGATGGIIIDGNTIGPARAGRLYGIGVGPGDPGLLTLRAVEALREVAAVLAPRSHEDRDSLALSIARPHLPPGCEILEVVFPMTENREVVEGAWASAADLMLSRVASGQSVAFLTLGDALLYSTWSYLLRTIRQRDSNAEVVTIPGITAMSACAAAAGVPLAEGRSPLLIWPDRPPGSSAGVPVDTLSDVPNVVFLKAGRHAESLAAYARVHGMQAVAVRRCSLPEQQITRDLSEWIEDPDYFTTALMRRETKR